MRRQTCEVPPAAGNAEVPFLRSMKTLSAILAGPVTCTLPARPVTSSRDRWPLHDGQRDWRRRDCVYLFPPSAATAAAGACP